MNDGYNPEYKADDPEEGPLECHGPVGSDVASEHHVDPGNEYTEEEAQDRRKSSNGIPYTACSLQLPNGINEEEKEHTETDNCLEHL